MFHRISHLLNRILDRAGRHRRLASGCILFGLIIGLMGFVLLEADGLTTFTVLHFAAAASFLWFAGDLIRRASLVDGLGIPHPSIGALIAAIGLLRISAPDYYTEAFGGVPAVGLSLLALAFAVVLLIAGDLRSSQPLSFAGRTILVIAGSAHGITQLTRMANGLTTYPLYSLGLGLVGVFVLAMVIFEARVLWLALQWLFAGHGTGN